MGGVKAVEVSLNGRRVRVRVQALEEREAVFFDVVEIGRPGVVLRLENVYHRIYE